MKINKYLRDSLGLIRRPILVNAILYYDNGEVKHENWGDDINYHFLKEISKRPVAHYNNNSVAFRFKHTNYLVIGSTINWLCGKNTIVWGAGMIDQCLLREKPKKVLAVRGPLSRRELLKQGVDCPSIYGDPALLVPRYLPMHGVEKKYELGIINHVSTIPHTRIKCIQENYGAKLIDLRSYDDWREVPREICECKRIMSSSLHGLIVSEAYGIPNVWFETQQLIGGHFKFHDFFLSVGVDREYPLCMTDSTTFEEIEAAFQAYKPGHIDLQPLLDACPFELKL